MNIIASAIQNHQNGSKLHRSDRRGRQSTMHTGQRREICNWSMHWQRHDNRLCYEQHTCHKDNKTCFLSLCTYEHLRRTSLHSLQNFLSCHTSPAVNIFPNLHQTHSPKQGRNVQAKKWMKHQHVDVLRTTGMIDFSRLYVVDRSLTCAVPVRISTKTANVVMWNATKR